MRLLGAIALAGAVLAVPAGARGEAASAQVVSHGAEMARADRLFEAGAWSEAAVVYHRVARGETGEGPAVRKIAAYRVAVALHYLGLHQASLGAFAPIADDPTHPGFGATLIWLSGLSTVMAEPDEVVALLGRYSLADAAPYDNPRQRLVHMRIAALLGRNAYLARRFDDAVLAFEKVGPESPYHFEAGFLTALSHVQRRKPEPALHALARLREVLERRPPGPERSRLLDLVHLSTARISYSTAARGGTVDAGALRDALESYRRVDPKGPSYAEALFESAWVDFMAGDHARALGNLTVFHAPAFQGFVNPEVPVLQGEISFALCQLDAAEAFGARTKERYGPVRREIAALIARLDAEGGTGGFLRFAGDLGAGHVALGGDARAIVEGALGDRQVRRRLAHLRDAGEERALLGRMPEAFRASTLGADTRDALDLARDLAAGSAGALVRARLVRAAGEIDQRLDQADALAADVALTRSTVAKAPRRAPRPPPVPAFALDREHVVWPFDGEVWADEVGSYRVAARSRCVR